MAITTHDHHPTLRHVERDALGVALQRVLVDLVDLSLAGKQLHWNVVGPHFRPLHLHLDDLVDSAREFADQVAERARALAWTPDGRRSTVASASTLPDMPDGEVVDVPRWTRPRSTTPSPRTSSIRSSMDSSNTPGCSRLRLRADLP
jgi:starvation-inducible DNA-binding protein